MKLILCVDDRGGMMFNNRRVSRDKLLISDLAELVGDATVFMEPYSAELFSDVSLNIICSSSPMKSAEKGDYAFVERLDPMPYAKDAEEIIIYKWNRRYPFDLNMGFKPEELGFKLKSVSEFQGNAHEKITREVYTE